MSKEIEQDLTDQVVASFGATPDARLRTLMQSLVRHVHAFVRDVEPTQSEWMAAIEFLTATGKMCDGVVRQEYILLSDVLGISMLVDAINHRQTSAATDTTVLGPFFIEGMPERAWGENMALTPGTAALVHGRVTDADGKGFVRIRAIPERLVLHDNVLVVFIAHRLPGRRIPLDQ